VRSVIIIAIAVVLLIPITVLGQIIPTTDELLNKAFALIQEGKYEDSILILNKVIETEPDNTIALYYRSSAHIGLEQFQDAKEDLDLIYALKKEPSGGIHYNHGLALFGLGEYEEAIEYFELIDEKDYNYINALNKKGIALLDLSRYEESVESFDLVIKDDPDNFTAHLYRGVSLTNLKDYDEAFYSLEIAQSIDSQNARLKDAIQFNLNQKGLSLFFDDSNYEEAKIYFEKALVNKPYDPNAASYLSMTESKLTEKRILEAADSVYVALALSIGGIALTVFLYYNPRKQK